METLNFRTPDRIPKDLGGMRSTSISAFAYPKLVKALGLPARLPKVEDTSQMLALPDMDVLDALGCDVVTVCDAVTNAFEQPDRWKDYDFNSRLPAQVRNPEWFRTEADGTITQGYSRMPASSYVFDVPHGGQPLDMSDDLPKQDLKKMRQRMLEGRIQDKLILSITKFCRRIRESTDKAVFLNNSVLSVPMGIANYGGMAVFSMQCLTEPDYVAELHEIVVENRLHNVNALLPEIKDYVDVMMMAADDWGTQKSLIASPDTYKKLFLPYYKQINDRCHELAPDTKLFLHSCGAIYDLLDHVIESGFDVVNPVQWNAGGHSYQEWKDKCRGRIAMWGGAVNSQVTLPRGTLEEIRKESTEVAEYLGQDAGFVFCNIHNILAEIEPERVMALYDVKTPA